MDEGTETLRSHRRELPHRSALLLARLVPRALGVALGAVVGLLIFVATAVLLVRGGDTVGPHLELLAWLLPGYRVTMVGALLGAALGFVYGYVAGYMFAALRNLAVAIYLRFVWSRLQHDAASDLLDRVS